MNKLIIMYYIYYYIYVKLPVYIISVSTNAFRQLSLNDDAVAICTGVAPTFISIYDEPPRSQTGGDFGDSTTPEDNRVAF